MAKWTAVEINTGVISACLPTLRPLIERIPSKLMSLGSWTVVSNRGSDYVSHLQTYKSRSARRAETDSMHRLPAHPLGEALSANSVEDEEHNASEQEAEP